MSPRSIHLVTVDGSVWRSAAISWLVKRGSRPRRRLGVVKRGNCIREGGDRVARGSAPTRRRALAGGAFGSGKRASARIERVDAARRADGGATRAPTGVREGILVGARLKAADAFGELPDVLEHQVKLRKGRGAMCPAPSNILRRWRGYLQAAWRPSGKVPLKRTTAIAGCTPEAVGVTVSLTACPVPGFVTNAFQPPERSTAFADPASGSYCT